MPTTRVRSAPPAPGALASTLQRLGFTDYESRAYLALAATHPATAYETAKSAGLPRANVYAALRSLEGKGAIQPVTEQPVRYVPVDPDRFFGELGDSMGALCETVARGVRAPAPASDDVYVWVHRGADVVHAKLTELIAQARAHILIKAPEERIAPLGPTLKAAAGRGVSVKIVAFGADLASLRTHPRVTIFPHEGDGQRHATAADVLFTMTVDSESAIIVSHASADTVGSFARNASIVYVLETLLLHEIYFAEIFAAFGPQLEKRYGKRLMKLRSKHRPRNRELSVLGATLQKGNA